MSHEGRVHGDPADGVVFALIMMLFVVVQLVLGAVLFKKKKPPGKSRFRQGKFKHL